MKAVPESLRRSRSFDLLTQRVPWRPRRVNSSPKLQRIDRRERLLRQVETLVKPETMLFGVPVDVAISRRNPSDVLPLPLAHAIGFLEKHRLTDEGLYRIPGSKLTVDLLKARYNAGLEVAIPANEEAGTCTSLIVAFLRELPGTIFSPSINAHLDELKDVAPEDRVQYMKALVDGMSGHPRAALGLFVTHLNHVQSHSAENLMTTRNLTLCLMPALSGPLGILIDNANDLFPEYANTDLAALAPPEAIEEADIESTDDQSNEPQASPLEGVQEEQKNDPASEAKAAGEKRERKMTKLLKGLLRKDRSASDGNSLA